MGAAARNPWDWHFEEDGAEEEGEGNGGGDALGRDRDGGIFGDTENGGNYILAQVPQTSETEATGGEATGGEATGGEATGGEATGAICATGPEDIGMLDNYTATWATGAATWATGKTEYVTGNVTGHAIEAVTGNVTSDSPTLVTDTVTDTTDMTGTTDMTDMTDMTGTTDMADMTDMAGASYYIDMPPPIQEEQKSQAPQTPPVFKGEPDPYTVYDGKLCVNELPILASTMLMINQITGKPLHCVSCGRWRTKKGSAWWIGECDICGERKTSQSRCSIIRTTWLKEEGYM